MGNLIKEVEEVLQMHLRAQNYDYVMRLCEKLLGVTLEAAAEAAEAETARAEARAEAETAWAALYSRRS